MAGNILQKLYRRILGLEPNNEHSDTHTDELYSESVLSFLNEDRKIALEKALSVKIECVELFERALTHRSYLQLLSDDRQLSNERLEFLGDAVLGLVVAEHLFSSHEETTEGELTKMRSWLVNKQSLAICAREIELDKFLMLSTSAIRSLEGGSDSILADALEAIIGAIYLDSGIDKARNFIVEILLPILSNENIMVDKNYKSILLEIVQAQGKPYPQYVLIEQTGPDHKREFTVGVYVEGKLLGTGTGKTKKQAEQVAAKNALELPIVSINN